ncbi:DUF4209 domain-containing protein [Paenibacillus sp. O199]|uniref:DUF4209 domain-containing protein n=1 Tax=Paenibacillus sp. O199 TaxID=1643925 RepID=UPI0007BEEFAE|nr:DUF4209 domain-containing protein [Paenibacillus sp. O199]
MDSKKLKILSTEDLLQLAEVNITDFRYGPSEIFKVAYEKFNADGNVGSSEKMHMEILISDLSTHASIQRQFREKFSGVNEDGSEIKYPDVDRDFPDAFFEYYEIRANETDNPRLKARYSDFIWERKRKFPLALIAIDAYLACSDVFYSLGWGRETKDALARAVQLALSINNKEKLKNAVEKTHSILDLMHQTKSFRYPFEIIGILIRNGSKIHDMLNLDNYLNILEDSISVYKSEPDAYQLQRANMEILVEINKMLRGEVKVETELTRIAETYIEEAKWKKEHYPNGNIVASHFYEEALKKYMELGNFPEKVEELKLKIAEANEQARLHEFQAVSATVEMQKERLDQYFQLSDQEDLEECIGNLISDPQIIPRWEDSIQAAEEQAKQLSILHKSPCSINKGNITVKKLFDPQEKIENQAVQQFVSHYKLEAHSVLILIFDKLFQRAGFLTKIEERFTESNFITEDRKFILMHGIQRFLDKDYISSTHILLFQVEGILRDILGKCGLPTFTYRNNEMRERMLPDIVETLGELRGFDPDFIRFINVFLNDIRGDNLRNDVAHGIVTHDVFNKSNSVLLIYLFLRLSNYRITSN